MSISIVWGPPADQPSGGTVVFSNVVVDAPTYHTTEATVEFDMAPAARGFVQFDPDAGDTYDFGTSVASALLTHHVATLQGLVADTTYRYRPAAVASDGTLSFGSEGTFMSGATQPGTTPGAVYGYGAAVVGGAGGTVMVVDNNNTSGSGSFYEAAMTNQPRIITFAVDGTINIPSTINPYAFVTVAGETSGGDGITFTGWAIQSNGTNRQQQIFRQLRHRAWQGGGAPSSNTGGECFGAINGAHHIVYQNLSMSHHADEVIGFWRGVHDVTIQDCIMGEGADSGHNYALLVGNNAAGNSQYGATTGFSIYRNLIYRSQYRNPNVGYDDSSGTIAPSVQADIANNLVWPGSVSNNYGTQIYWGGKANVRYNYYGDTSNAAVSAASLGTAYSLGNVSRNGRSTSGNTSVAYTIPTAATLPYLTDAEAAAEEVLANAGCRVGGLDSYDFGAIGAIQSAGL